MARSPHEIESDLDSLMPEDFDLWQQDSHGMDRLYQLTDEIDQLAQPHCMLPTLFRTLERLVDVDIGSPGPIVHTIERIGGYEPLLIESIQRKPTALTAWLVNRLLNTIREQTARERWLTLLKQALGSADISSRTQQTIMEFITFQLTKGSDTAQQ
jgi:hypothetical protein